MAVRNHLSPARGYGSNVVALITFVPGTTPTVTEQWGVRSLARGGAGDYTITLLGKPKGFSAVVSIEENDTTLYHFARVESKSVSAGTVTISHKSVAFASVASGPTLSDTVDSITVVVYERSE